MPFCAYGRVMFLRTCDNFAHRVFYLTISRRFCIRTFYSINILRGILLYHWRGSILGVEAWTGVFFGMLRND